MEITVVENGYILELEDFTKYVFKTKKELLEFLEEYVLKDNF